MKGAGEGTEKKTRGIFASQLFGHIDKFIDTRIIIDAIVIYVILAVLG